MYGPAPGDDRLLDRCVEWNAGEEAGRTQSCLRRCRRDRATGAASLARQMHRHLQRPLHTVTDEAVNCAGPTSRTVVRSPGQSVISTRWLLRMIRVSRVSSIR